MAARLFTLHFRKSNGRNPFGFLHSRRFINGYKRTIPCFTFLTGYKGKGGLFLNIIRHSRRTAQSFGHRAESRKHRTVFFTLHPHIHQDIILIGHLDCKNSFYIFTCPGTFLIEQVRIGIQMRAGKGKLFGRLQMQISAICSGQGHFLSQVMIEIIVHFISATFFTATENIYVVTGFGTGGNDAHHTCLVRTAFRFTEINIAVRYGRKFFLYRRSRGRCRKTGQQIE